MIFRGKLFKFKSRYRNCQLPGFDWLLKIAFRSVSLSTLSLVGCIWTFYQFFTGGAVEALYIRTHWLMVVGVTFCLELADRWTLGNSDELLLRGEDIEWNCLFMYFREMKSDYPTKSGFFTYGWAVMDLAVKSNRRCGWYDSLIAWPLLRRLVFSLISHEVFTRVLGPFLNNCINNLVKEQNRL